MIQSREEEAVVQKFRDVSSWTKRCELLEVPQANIKGDLSFRANLVSTICKDTIKYQLNQNQLGVAVTASWMLSTKLAQQQIWIVPGGLGKSRILIGIMLGLALGPKTQYHNFHVVYNHKQLYLQDKGKLDDVARLHGLTV